MTNYTSKPKWAWQAQFLSHNLVILKYSVFFKDKQMILVSFFDIFTGFKFPKNLKSLHIQFLIHPCLITLLWTKSTVAWFEAWFTIFHNMDICKNHWIYCVTHMYFWVGNFQHVEKKIKIRHKFNVFSRSKKYITAGWKWNWDYVECTLKRLWGDETRPHSGWKKMKPKILTIHPFL